MTLESGVLFGGGGEEDIAATVKGGLDGVLYDTDDEADSYCLHGDIVPKIPMPVQEGTT